MSLFDYVNSWEIALGSLDKKFFGIWERTLKNQLPNPHVLKIIRQLKELPLVSTIDHHGILNHPFFVNSNLIYSLYDNLEYLIVLSTEGVSLNNSSWPGCLLYRQKGGLKKISIFTDKEKNKPVLAQKAFTKKQAQGMLVKIGDENLKRPAQKIFLDPKVLKQKAFSAQINLINYRLWQKIFPKAPKVVYVPLEDLISEVIVKLIAKDKSHVLHRLFFKENGWKLIKKYFEGLKGAFGPGKKGSFLFWGIDATGKRLQLFRQGSKIRDQGSAISVFLIPKEVARALKEKKIYPTSLVCFLVLLYYQITCLGGFNQITWLTEIKEKFVGLLKELKASELAQRINKVPTDNFAEGNLAFLYHQGQLIKPTGLDIYLAGNMYRKYQNLAKSITVGESIETLLPEMYRIVVPEKQRQKNLLNITDEQIAKANGLQKKVKKIIAGRA